ncbi:Na-translocating system protein MpsB [Pullulanibacillus sp. KACC 23026]|uniref:DUF2309 domain-containing protein n=1 Tax=Pullulanibacillus sp. KACC 23026 TaxID=3028315 RepID=UPI0023B1D4F3|nr:putative inorganic carbon transporter subunit DabA [Pullulanibacillus sp. KACC 23026]WEG12483.1 Na-translocating system protein MpsB [Pullulanibacillus sp. KACC 23026]
MSGTSTLPKEDTRKKDERKTDYKVIGLDECVQLASRVIVPLSPISTFAARHPWEGLEELTFDQVADWLKKVEDVDLYPSPSLILSAKERDEIDRIFLEKGLEEWLNSYSFNVPRDMAERFCRASLKLDSLPSSLLASPELKEMAESIGRLSIAGLENDTMQPMSEHIEHKKGETLAKILDQLVIKWCKLYLDDAQAAWKMPSRDQGFYGAWRRLIQYDPALTKYQRERLKHWPKDAHSAIDTALKALNILESEKQTYLEGHLLALPGWAGMMLWRSQQSTYEQSLLIDYLAVRLTIEWVLMKPYLPIPRKNVGKKIELVPLLASWIEWGGLTIKKWSTMSDHQQIDYLKFAYHFNNRIRYKIWLEAWEQTFENQLAEKLISKRQMEAESAKAVVAQLAFCIDTRSEPFRRHLEKEGPFETIGVAGFFGLPILTSELGSKHCHASLPVMHNPQHKIIETSNETQRKSYQQRKQVVDSTGYTFKKMKQNVLASLLLPEISGPWLGLSMVSRSFIPRVASRFIRRLRETWLQKPDTELQLENNHDIESEIPIGFTEEERVSYASQTLKMMGLTKNFAPLVVICGHGSQSLNNPYAASLECGACGGAAGGFNARVLATLCNLQEVREKLSVEGIKIPEETVFVAAEHQTTVDELKWIYVPKLSNQAQDAFERIKAVLPKVSHDANEERLAQLPNIKSHLKDPTEEAHRFAEDWSEIRPEWGLARNAAFIIGKRQLTKDCHLEGRVFLHNYDWEQDQNGNLLSNIIAGPGTVAQWINLQYYASTVAPHYYGSGNKRTQTVTAGLGVMQGTASDLLTGLPWQSVMESDYKVYHAPLRLLIVIQAPREYVERLLKKDVAFHQKVKNGWIRLASIDSEGCWENW